MSNPPTSPPPPQQPSPYQAASYTPTGVIAYGLGFLAFIPVPFFGVIVAAIAMWVSGAKLRKGGGMAAENGRRAANWGITLLAVIVLLVIAQITLAIVFAGTKGFFPIGTPIALYFVLAAIHVVVIIVGVVKARTGVFNNPLAFPFLR